MPDIEERVVAALRDVDFDTHYYDFYDRIRNRTTPSGLTKPDWEKALADAGLDVRYSANEGFFSTRRRVGGCTVTFDITFGHDEVGLGMSVDAPDGDASGPFALLANAAGTARDPDFSPSPPYPTFPFSNPEQLREALGFAVTLFDDVERALTSAKLCEVTP
jgi:hypothetical protein